ncbi:MAG: DNA primase [bacterium]|nr:DNA primase [bacterium]
MASVVEQIKSKLSIVDVIGSYIKLERAGSNFKARCPFHNEKTASFFISPSRETYHCFGCNRGGDMLSFVQEIEGLDFRGALGTLAERAGVRMNVSEPGESREREKIFAVLEESTKFFSNHLEKNKESHEYLIKRGIMDETIKEFRLGYAPSEWRSLSEFLQKKGFTPEHLLKAGLSIKSEKGYYDRFRGRVMFPIADNGGKIVGFSGRILPGTEQGDVDKQAKYVNSPETEVFHKSKILYGFDKAKQSIRKENTAVLVEGQMDLVLSHQSGVVHTVASSGTALTKDHLILIKRLADTLVIAFDADEAGLSASKKGVDLALSLGFDVRVAEIPSGLDPADVVMKDPEGWKHSVLNARHIIDFYLKALSGKGYDMRTFRKKTSELVLPYIVKLRNTIDQAHFVSETARALHLSEEPIWEELKKLRGNELADTSYREPEEKADKSSQSAELGRRQNIERKILGILLWQESTSKPLADRVGWEQQYGVIVGESTLKEKKDLPEKEKNNLIFEAEIYYQDLKELPQEIELLLANLEEEVLKEQLVIAMDELRDVEHKGDTTRSMEILKKCQEISKKLSEIVKK